MVIEFALLLLISHPLMFYLIYLSFVKRRVSLIFMLEAELKLVKHVRLRDPLPVFSFKPQTKRLKITKSLASVKSSSEREIHTFCEYLIQP
jgi:hypothetical protein